MDTRVTTINFWGNLGKLTENLVLAILQPVISLADLLTSKTLLHFKSRISNCIEQCIKWVEQIIIQAVSLSIQLAWIIWTKSENLTVELLYKPGPKISYLQQYYFKDLVFLDNFLSTFMCGVPPQLFVSSKINETLFNDHLMNSWHNWIFTFFLQKLFFKFC